MGFKLGKNGLLKRTEKPQLTRKQRLALKSQKSLEAIAKKSGETKSIITRRAGETIQKTTTVTCPICKASMELKKPNIGQPFWGCTNFKTTGCTGSHKYTSSGSKKGEA